MQSTLDEVWNMAEDMRSSQAHIRRQARLVYGILLYNTEKHGSRDVEAGAPKLKRDIDNRRKDVRFEEEEICGALSF